MRLAVVDGKDREIAASRDIHSLQTEALSSGESQAFKTLQTKWEKAGLTAWDFGNLPESIPLQHHGHSEGYAFPALTAGNDAVDIRLFRTEREALASHIIGVRTLYTIRFREELRHLKKGLTLIGDMKLWAAELTGIKAFEQALLEYVMHDLFDRNIRTGEAFQRCADEVRLQILPAGQKAIHTARPVLKAYCDCLTALRGMEQANRFNKPVQQFLAELRLEIGNLVPPHFLELYSPERLTHIIRYLKALTIRANRGTIHLEKDMTKAQELKPFAAWYEDISSSLPDAATDEKRKALEEFRWMLEEYKISLFAQELKTAFPISPKRLHDRMQAIERIF